MSAFRSSEPLVLLRLMGMSVPSLHIESTNSMISTTLCADPTLNIENLRGVMASVKKWFALGHLASCLNVPIAVCTAINDDPDYKTVKEKKEALLRYYLRTLPMASWQHVIGALYFNGEKTALEAAMDFLKYAPAGQCSIHVHGELAYHAFGCLYIHGGSQRDRGIDKITSDPLSLQSLH